MTISELCYTVPCSEGTYLDTTNPMNPGWKDCPVGTYKESPEDSACYPCPPGTSTEKTGSTNITCCLSKMIKIFLLSESKTYPYC